VKRVTADSNILISAFLRAGKPLERLELARAGQFELAVSDAILDETARVLKTKFRVPDEDVRDFGRELLGFVNRPCAHGSRASLRSHDDDLDA
jgi:predicted nucleic acid-binding protein